jgi:lysozyme
MQWMYLEERVLKMVNKLSQIGINLIKKFEGCRLKAYKCPAGVWTIGYGSTAGVKEGQVITQQQADNLLEKDLQRFVDGVNKLVTVDLNQNQFDSLVSFAYNCGVGALQRSTLLEYVNKKQFEKASAEFDNWNKGGGKVLQGIVRRRDEEQALFLNLVKEEKSESNIELIREIKRKALAGKKLVSPTPETIKIYECYAPYPK